MKKFYIIFFGLLLIQNIGNAGGNLTDFILEGAGARPISMGSAFTAVANDANSFFWNPAGLSYVMNRQFSSIHKTLSMWDIRTDSLTFISPFVENVGFGAGYLHTSISGIPITRWPKICWEVDKNGEEIENTRVVQEWSYVEKENERCRPIVNKKDLLLAGVSYIGYVGGVGYKLSDLWRIGAVVKYYHQELAGFDKTSVLAFDLGALYKYGKRLNLGLNLQNIYLISGPDKPPFRIRAGSAYNDIVGKNHPITFSFDIEMLKRRPSKHCFGLEYKLNSLVTTRFGLNDGNFTGGIGLHAKKWKLDYAFQKAESEYFDDSHFLTATYVFEEERKIARKKIFMKKEVEKKDIVKEPVRKAGERIEKVIDELEKIVIPKQVEETYGEKEEVPLYLKWPIPSIKDFKEEPLKEKEKTEIRIERLKEVRKKEEHYLLKSKKFIDVIERETPLEKKERRIDLELQKEKTQLKLLLLNGKEIEIFDEKEMSLGLTCKEIKERGYNNKIIIEVMNMQDKEMQRFVDALKVNLIDYWALLNIGRVLLEKGEPKKAIDIINIATHYYPDEARAYNLKGCLFLLNRCFTEAEEEFKKSIMIDESYLNPYNNLAILYVYVYKDYNKAYEIVSKIFDKNKKERNKIVEENLKIIIEKLQ